MKLRLISAIAIIAMVLAATLTARPQTSFRISGNGSAGIVYIGPSASLPANCNIGDLSLATDATASAQMYVATAVGPCTWTQQTGGGSMVYPGAGLPISTGSAWSSSISETDGDVVYGSGGVWTKSATPGISITGTSGGLSGSPAIAVSSCSGCGSGGFIQLLTADVSPGSTANTLATSGMTFSLAASTSYTLECGLMQQPSATSSVGFTFGVTGPGTPTAVILTMRNQTTQTAIRSEYSNSGSWGAKLGATATTYDTNPVPVFVSGVIQNGTTAGTMTIEYANIGTTGTETLKAGSWCKLQ